MFKLMGKKKIKILHAQKIFIRTYATTPRFMGKNINDACGYTPGRRQSKTLILSTNVDQKSLGTEFSIAICRPTGDK